jgi:phospholipase C
MAVAVLALFALMPGSAGRPDPVSSSATGINLIDHVVIIMQENRSFDHYFGTYPGVEDGINPNSPPCIPDAETANCVPTYHDPRDDVLGAPHGEQPALHDMNNGKMDGFVTQAAELRFSACLLPHDPSCTRPNSGVDIMGLRDQRELPNYWTYADQYVLQDHMYEPTFSYTLPAHLFMVSGWSASCTDPADPMTCHSQLANPGAVPNQSGAKAYTWTDVTQLLYTHGVTWAYYVSPGTEPDCEDNSTWCTPKTQRIGSISQFNPLPEFNTVQDNHQLGNIKTSDNFIAAAQNGTLPSVSWVVPSGTNSEHPHATPSRGTGYVTTMINAAMSGPDWDHTAIFLAWDDWGGFYDGSVPPNVDENGYGLRVPAMLISPYAKKGYIDHQTLSFDAYLKFIEDVFLNGERIDPATDGRPDSRPTVRENLPQLGDLTSEFDFTQQPRPPMILPVYPFPAPGQTGS